MATPNLNNTGEEILTGKDSIVIVDNFQSIRGGRSLDVTGYPHDVINAGHVIIMATANNEYKPMPLNVGGDAYAALPADHVYAGILVSSVLKSRPFAGIMVRGTVNTAATPFAMTSILAAVKTALPLIDFRQD